MISIPTLNQLYTGIISDLETKYGGSLPTFGKNFLRAMAGVQAAKLWLLYKANAFTQKNIFIDTADSEAIGGTLERFGRVKLGRNPFAAVAGIYKVNITGTIGATIPASTTFKSDDDSASPGYLFVLDTSYTLTGSSGSIDLRALTAGLESELEIGNTLTPTAPIALVDPSGVVAAITTVPQAAEDLEDYRQKGIEAYRLEAQGGAGSDYRLWSYDAQGVKTTYPYAVSGNTNEINLYVEATIADSVDGYGTPTATTLTEVQEAIELPTIDRPSRKPLTVYQINYLPIEVKFVSIEITGFVGLTVDIQTAIFDSIKDYLSNVRPFVSSIDVLANQNDTFGVNTAISLIIAAVPGSLFGSVMVEVDSTPYTSYQFMGGEIPSLNSISYV